MADFTWKVHLNPDSELIYESVYKLQWQAAEAKTNLLICTVSPDPPHFTYTKDGSRIKCDHRSSTNDV